MKVIAKRVDDRAEFFATCGEQGQPWFPGWQPNGKPGWADVVAKSYNVSISIPIMEIPALTIEMTVGSDRHGDGDIMSGVYCDGVYIKDGEKFIFEVSELSEATRQVAIVRNAEEEEEEYCTENIFPQLQGDFETIDPQFGTKYLWAGGFGHTVIFSDGTTRSRHSFRFFSDSGEFSEILDPKGPRSSAKIVRR